MSKYTYEEKIAAVLRVIDDNITIKESAHILGAPVQAVMRWVEYYKKYGKEGLSIKYKTYSGDFKVSVVEYMHKNNLTLLQTAVHFGIASDSTVYSWERIYTEKGAQGLYPDQGESIPEMSTNTTKEKELNERTKEDLIEEIQKLRTEVAYLKKSTALVQERTSQKNVRR